MPLRHQDSKNHKCLLLNKLHLVKLSALGDFVAKNGFSEWAQFWICFLHGGQVVLRYSPSERIHSARLNDKVGQGRVLRISGNPGKVYAFSQL